MKANKISINEIVSYLPDELINKIGQEVAVDYQVKYLYGKDVLYLLLYSHLNTKSLSLRECELLSQSKVFQVFVGKTSDYSVPHTTLADRLNSINVKFFENIYLSFIDKLQTLYTADQYKARKIIRYDSTFVGLTSKLLKIGMQNGTKSTKDKPAKNYIKFTIGFNGLVPTDCKMYKKQPEVSDEISFAEIIEESSLSSKDIVVFDRGLKKRKTLKEFWESDIYFVTRAEKRIKYKEIEHIPFSKNNNRDTDRLIFKKDIIVNLYDAKTRIYKEPYRLIIYTSKETGEEIKFLTNIFDLSAIDISEIYALRWDIEVFFKFLKQELNFKHFLSRNENGIQVNLYVTLIMSIMLMIYKKVNKMNGYKLPKIQFYYDLQTEITKIIVKLVAEIRIKWIICLILKVSDSSRLHLVPNPQSLIIHLFPLPLLIHKNLQHYYISNVEVQ